MKQPLTIATARAELGISRTTMLYHIALGHFGKVEYKIIDGRRTTLIPASAVMKFMDERVKVYDSRGPRWIERCDNKDGN